MFKLLKVVIPSLALSVLVGCGGSSTDEAVNDVLDKDSVALTGLSSHLVTYEKTSDKATHTDVYCPPNDLRDANGAANGDWSILGNDLTTNPTVGTAYTYTTNGTLVKNTTYNTNTADSFKVTKILETICL
ncbi:hypothetical protein [Kaarinaea lacus]